MPRRDQAEYQAKDACQERENINGAHNRCAEPYRLLQNQVKARAGMLPDIKMIFAFGNGQCFAVLELGAQARYQIRGLCGLGMVNCLPEGIQKQDIGGRTVQV